MRRPEIGSWRFNETWLEELLRSNAPEMSPHKTVCHESFSSCFLFSQANIKEAEVTIPAKLHNSLIGSKGCLVRSIMEDCGGVHIHFPSEGSGSDKVTIRGPVGEVEKAKKQLLQLAEEKVRYSR